MKESEVCYELARETPNFERAKYWMIQAIYHLLDERLKEKKKK